MIKWLAFVLLVLLVLFYFKIRSNHISYVISSHLPYEFCNGNQMQSDEWVKTITITQEKRVRHFWVSHQQMLNLSVLYASQAMHLSKHHVIPQITLSRGIAYVAPVEGFAGVSIWMCQFKPLIEKNIRQYPFVQKIVWQSM